MMNHAITALLFSSLSLAPTLAFAENNNDFKNDINATSLGTRMKNAFTHEEKKTVSAAEVEAARMEEVRLAAERDALWAEQQAEQRRAAALEERAEAKRERAAALKRKSEAERAASVRTAEEQRRLEAERKAAETRSAAMESTAGAAAVATGAAAGLTAGDQSTTAADVELTRIIRQDIMKQNLSMNAKNVKIITIDGVVTLKGHVNNIAEKQAVSNTASAHAGAAKVRNELVVQE